MDVFLIFPKSQQAQKELGQQLAKFQADQALKVPSRFMRKIVCRLRLSEINRQ